HMSPLVPYTALFRSGRNLELLFESAEGVPMAAAQIARRLVLEAPDAIVAISTPSAQAVAGATKDIPIVFSAVTDPLGARLVSDLDRKSTRLNSSHVK